MDTPQAQKSKRKGIIVGGLIALFVVVGIANMGSDNTKNANTTSSIPITSTTQTIDKPADTKEVLPAETPVPAAAPVPAPAATPAPAPAPKPSCPADHYINTAGNCVQSPTAAPSAPAGATAQCKDGTYSFSQSRSGTCSHHGGVAVWF
jgi:hypothetical protein